MDHSAPCTASTLVSSLAAIRGSVIDKNGSAFAAGWPALSLLKIEEAKRVTAPHKSAQGSLRHLTLFTGIKLYFQKMQSAYTVGTSTPPDKHHIKFPVSGFTRKIKKDPNPFTVSNLA